MELTSPIWISDVGGREGVRLLAKRLGLVAAFGLAMFGVSLAALIQEFRTLFIVEAAFATAVVALFAFFIGLYSPISIQGTRPIGPRRYFESARELFGQAGRRAGLITLESGIGSIAIFSFAWGVRQHSMLASYATCFAAHAFLIGVVFWTWQQRIARRSNRLYKGRPWVVASTRLAGCGNVLAVGDIVRIASSERGNSFQDALVVSSEEGGIWCAYVGERAVSADRIPLPYQIQVTVRVNRRARSIWADCTSLHFVRFRELHSHIDQVRPDDWTKFYNEYSQLYTDFAHVKNGGTASSTSSSSASASSSAKNRDAEKNNLPSDVDYFEVLGLQPGATQDDVRKAYRRLAKQAHPDAGGSPFLMRLIQQAYESLVDDPDLANRGDDRPRGPAGKTRTSTSAPLSGADVELRTRYLSLISVLAPQLPDLWDVSELADTSYRYYFPRKTGS